MSCLNTLVNQYSNILIFNGRLYIPARDGEAQLPGVSFTKHRSIDQLTQRLSLLDFSEQYIVPALKKQKADSFSRGKKEDLIFAFPSTRTHPLVISQRSGTFFEADGNRQPYLKINNETYGVATEYPIEKIQEQARKKLGPESTKISETTAKAVPKDSDVLLIQKMGSFAIQINKTTYFFEGPEIGVALHKDPRGVSIEKPHIHTPDYNHPFVYADGRICFNDRFSSKRWKDDNIHFDFVENYQTEDFIGMIKRTFNQAQDNLARGYFAGAKPIRRLSDGDFTHEAARGAAIGR